MSTRPRVLVISGSARSGSLNQRLAAVAAGLAEQAGAQVTTVDLRALALPIYDADLEALGMPEGARQLRRLFAEHDALLLVSPEYNGFPTPLLINALDWVTRPAAEEGLPSGIASLTGTVAGLFSASPGALGGLRSLLFTRQFLQMNLGMLVVPEQFGLALAEQAFDESGALRDPKSQAAVSRVVQSVLRTTAAVTAPAA
ncbi:MAG: NAD(P)H-dependent oxidoreductase [Rhizobacter sp.]|nr:NAD(P)H-dependent oxidoreductase [Rhizobacter sp.]MBP6268143.1 NAD(P)H-dependent oxidoreductase [Rhizobacter sp.]